MHEQYLRQIQDKDKSNTWKGLRKSSLKGCTEALISSAQEQALRTNYVKFYIDKTGESLYVECVEWKTRLYHIL